MVWGSLGWKGHPFKMREFFPFSPSHLTLTQLTEALINNYGQSWQNVQELPVCTSGLQGRFLFSTAADKPFHLRAQEGDHFYIDGVLSSSREIAIATPAVGDSFSLYSFKSGENSYDWYINTEKGTLQEETYRYVFNAEPSSAETLTLNLSLPAGKEITIDWGDGNTTTVTGEVTNTDYSHAYSSAGTYPITIYGDFDALTRLNIEDIAVKGVVKDIELLENLNHLKCAYGLISGDVLYLPRTLNYFDCYLYDTANLIAYWSFNEGSGSVVKDRSGYGNDAHLTGSITWENGVIGNSLLFNGVDTEGAVLDTSYINTMGVYTRTYSLWVKASSTTGMHILYKEGGGVNGLAIYIEDGVLYFTYWTDNHLKGYCSIPFTYTDWEHITCVFDSASGFQGIYLNGEEGGGTYWQDNNTSYIKAHEGDINIGSNYSPVDGIRDHNDNWVTSKSYYYGLLDEIAIFNRVLNTNEIKAIFNNPNIVSNGIVLSGDIGHLPELSFFRCVGSNIINTYTSRTWTTKPSTFIFVPTFPGGLSSAEVDQLLIDFNNDLTWASGDVIQLTGANAPRTSASDTAVAIMTAEGATIITN